MKRLAPISLVLITATAGLAHEGVRNPTVQARMSGMTSIAESVKVLGEMSKGTMAFDAMAARAAALEIATHAAAAPGLFEAPEDDPKSEALPAIWEDFDDFTARSLDLEAIALDLSATLTTREDLRPALRRLGANCKACHEVYRK